VDACELSSAGWGVVFADDIEPDIPEALEPLLERRAAQAGELYRRLCHRVGETKSAWLVRHGVGPGIPLPRKVPFYLLLVGDPERISYRFQYELDVTYAVGRLYLPTVDAYRQYALNVVRSETAEAAPPERSVAFFGVRNDDDEATRLSADYLVAPLSNAIASANPSWQVTCVSGEQATKSRLRALLGGPETPRLLFTASHGMAFPRDDELQAAHQGALLCQNWPGPREHAGPIPSSYYFSGDDVDPEANLEGAISFHFACFAAGTPRLDEFAAVDVAEPEHLADQAFVARLPQRLLAHRRGPLAVVGHVDRAWGFSFLWDDVTDQYEHFRSALTFIMDGKPLGLATEFFNARYADIASTLTMELEELRFGKIVDELLLADLWTANTDARNVVIIGDPAVRLRGGDL
jgi:hypothetical protein